MQFVLKVNPGDNLVITPGDTILVEAPTLFICKWYTYPVLRMLYRLGLIK